MSLIKIDEDLRFLEGQREKGRRGVMVGVDQTLVHQKERTMRRRVAAEMGTNKENPAMAIATEVTILDDSSSDDSTFTFLNLRLNKNLRLVYRFLKLQD